MKQAQDDVKNQTSEFLTYASEVWYLNYYLSYDVCACFRPSVRLSECLSANFFFRPKWIKFANSVNRHLEF